MMMNCLPKMLSQETDIVVKFMNNAIYQAETMKDPLTVPWEEGKEQLMFACHTSIITREIINE